jgi:hypothetical protein
MARAAEGQGSPLVGRLGQHTGEAWAGVEISMENQSGCRRLLGRKQGWALELFFQFFKQRFEFKSQ